MTAYLNVIEAVSARHNDKIKKACAYLFDCFGFGYFYYYKISDRGHFTGLTSNFKCNLYNTDQKAYLTYPFYRHPKYISSGIIIPSEVKAEPFPELLNSCKCKFNIHVNLIILNKTANGFEEFGFGSSSHHEMPTTLLVNELPLLRLFARKFLQDNQFLFSLMEDNQIDLAKLIGPTFYERALPEIPKPRGKLAFLQKMGIEIDNELSQREIDVVRRLLKGCSASQIAKEIYLSKRTVEHHIERIKMKLSCFSKSELITKFRDLEQIGYFSS
jgi:DNA-binding CsgD family transcriptional regulator